MELFLPFIHPFSFILLGARAPPLRSYTADTADGPINNPSPSRYTVVDGEPSAVGSASVAYAKRRERRNSRPHLEVLLVVLNFRSTIPLRSALTLPLPTARFLEPREPQREGLGSRFQEAGGGARPGGIELGRDRVGFDRGTRSRAAYLSVRRGDMQVRERIDRSIGRSIDRSGIGEATRGGGDERARRGLSMTGRGMSRG